MGDRKTLVPKQSLTYFMAAISILMWSTNLPATRYLLDYFTPGSIALLRTLISMIFLCILGAVKRIPLPKKRDLHMFALCGISGVSIFMVFQTIGARYVVSGVGSFLISVSPVFTLILATLLLKEYVKPICWAGVALSFCGLATIMASQIAEFSLNIGVFLFLLAAFVTSIFNIIQRGLLRNYTPLEVVTYAMIAATVCLLFWIPNIVRELPASSLENNLMMLYLGVFPGALAHISWTYALSKAEKTTYVTVFLYLTPFAATVIAYLWLGESFSLISFFGGVVIVAGMVLTNTLGKR